MNAVVIRADERGELWLQPTRMTELASLELGDCTEVITFTLVLPTTRVAL